MSKTEHMTQPELFVDSHHGVYMYQLAWNYLSDTFKQQAREQGITKEDEQDLVNGPDSEHYFDAADTLERVIFILPDTGDKFYIGHLSDESDLWLIPEGYQHEE